MELNPFPRLFKQLGVFYHIYEIQILLLGICAIGLYLLWYNHWKTKYRRTMRAIFHRCGLYIRLENGKNVTRLYPLFSSYDVTDEEYLIMKYHLRPGLALPQFEEKKKHIEAAFNSKVVVYGRGKFVFFKIKKVPYDEPGIYPDA